jgi:RimJ/RimL family protein N-acetyltransferase
VTADIVTDRLTLRLMTLDQARAIANGERRDAWAEGYPIDDERDVARLLLASGHEQIEAIGIRQIVDRETGLVTGGIGFFGGPDDDGVINVGYGVAPEARNRGYAAEALAAVLDVVRADARITRVHADTTIDNVASVRVLEKAGFALTRLDGPTVHYEYAVR